MANTRLPQPLLDALLDATKADAEKTNVIHQLNTHFLAATSFSVVESMAQSACKPKVVRAACELLVSGDALAWMVLVFLRYVAYADGALQLFESIGVLPAVLGMMRGLQHDDHQLRLALELLTLLFQSPAASGERSAWDRAPPSHLEHPLKTLTKCGACGQLCQILKAGPNEAIGMMVVALLQLLLATPAGRRQCAKAGLERIVDEQFPESEAAAVRSQLARDGE
jgi:hypothetical protein